MHDAILILHLLQPLLILHQVVLQGQEPIVFLIGLYIVAGGLEIQLCLYYLLCITGGSQEGTLHCRLVEDGFELFLSFGRF